MKTEITLPVLQSINELEGTKFMLNDLGVFIHCEDRVSEHWGVYSWTFEKYYIVSRYGDKYSAYDCKDHTHVKYMMLKMAF